MSEYDFESMGARERREYAEEFASALERAKAVLADKQTISSLRADVARLTAERDGETEACVAVLQKKLDFLDAGIAEYRAPELQGAGNGLANALGHRADELNLAIKAIRGRKDGAT